MINSKEVQQTQHHGSLPRRESAIGSAKSADASPEDSIPPRYRDNRGGIDLERVQMDQNEARRQVIQVMVRRIETLWRRCFHP